MNSTITNDRSDHPSSSGLGRGVQRLVSIHIPSLKELLHYSTLLIGLVLVVCSLVQGWFSIPAFQGGQAHMWLEIVPTEPACQNTFKGIIAVGLGLFGLSLLFRGRIGQLTAPLIACNLVLVSLAFPYFVMIRSPDIAADATWLQMQHDNLTWLGGDINSSAESGEMAWKSKVYWSDPPRQVAIAPLPTWSAWEVGLDKIEDVLIWTGYSNVFCQFVRKGWFSAICGSLLLGFSALCHRGKFNLDASGYLACYLCLAIAAATLFALSGPFRTKHHLASAQVAMSDGDNERALEHINRCAKLFHPLTNDTNFVVQKGLLENELGKESEFASLYQARGHESEGRYDVAYEIWQSLSRSTNKPIQREALRAIQRYAIHDYNSNRFELARQRLEYVLSRQPGNLKAIYLLQILSIRENNPEETYRLNEWMYEVATYLNFNTSKVVKAASQRNARMAAALSGDPLESWHRSIGAARP